MGYHLERSQACKLSFPGNVCLIVFRPASLPVQIPLFLGDLGISGKGKKSRMIMDDTLFPSLTRQCFPELFAKAVRAPQHSIEKQVRTIHTNAIYTCE